MNRSASSVTVPSSIRIVLTQRQSPPLRTPGNPWSLMIKVSGAWFDGVRMLCVVVQMVHVLSDGSKEDAKFWCWLLLVLLRDARKSLLMSCSSSKLLYAVCLHDVVVPVSRLWISCCCCALLAALVW